MDMDDFNPGLELIHRGHVRHERLPAENVVRVLAVSRTRAEVLRRRSNGEACLLCRHALDSNGLVLPYEPLVVQFNYPLVLDGGNHLFLQIGIDAYQSQGTRSRSTTAIYLSIANLERAHATQIENLRLLALLPPRTDISVVLARVSRDIAEMQRPFQCYDISHPDRIASDISCSPANFPADLPQVRSDTIISTLSLFAWSPLLRSLLVWLGVQQCRTLGTCCDIFISTQCCTKVRFGTDSTESDR
jgi:hypothetical protein